MRAEEPSPHMSSCQAFRHLNEVKRHLHACWVGERQRAAVAIPEARIEAEQVVPLVNESELNPAAPGGAARLLGGRHQSGTEPFSLMCWIYRKQADVSVSAFAANEDTANEGLRVSQHEKLAL